MYLRDLTIGTSHGVEFRILSFSYSVVSYERYILDSTPGDNISDVILNWQIDHFILAMVHGEKYANWFGSMQYNHMKSSCFAHVCLYLLGPLQRMIANRIVAIIFVFHPTELDTACKYIIGKG